MSRKRGRTIEAYEKDQRALELRKGGVKALYRAPGRSSQIAVPRLI